MDAALRFFKYKDKQYQVDAQGFLMVPEQWDENFAIGVAPDVKIASGLSDRHWRVINFIRNTFEIMSVCPLVYVACRENDLGLGDLEELFPTGYLRGACKLAGVTYRDAYMQKVWMDYNLEHNTTIYHKKEYITDEAGFLVNPADWDENFALHKAAELKIPGLLTEAHWKIIYCLRKTFAETGVVPTVYQTCNPDRLSIDELEKLFPTGYHRGAVMIAGLRVR